MDSIHSSFALVFAKALVEGRYQDAHAMLAPALAAGITAASLEADYTGMIEYGDSPPLDFHVVTTLEAWRDKQPGDIGWAYVAIWGDGFSEAVAVVVTDDEGRPAIRAIEWGRP